jgi:hypothetical protein
MMMAQKRQSSRPFPLIETDGWSWLTSADDKQLESPFFGTNKKCMKQRDDEAQKRQSPNLFP